MLDIVYSFISLNSNQQSSMKKENKNLSSLHVPKWQEKYTNEYINEKVYIYMLNNVFEKSSILINIQNAN